MKQLLITCVALSLFTTILRADEPTIGKAQQEFSSRLFGVLAKEPGNVVASPASIGMAMSMVAVGARGDTMRELLHVLNPQENDSWAVARGYQKLLATVRESKSVEVTSADAVWTLPRYPIQPQFSARMRDLGATSHEVQFTTQSGIAEINQWASKNTRGRIPVLFTDPLDPDTRLVLTDAIYFKGLWLTQFEKKLTRPDDFKITPEKKKQVQMMHRADGFGYAENEDYQVLRMPYKGEELSMVVLLPRDHAKMAKVQEKVAQQGWTAAMGELHQANVIVSMPRFTVSKDMELVPKLKEMGIQRAFTGGADFSGICSVERLFISNVIHKVWMQVDEEGTEAAAVTAVVMAKGASDAHREMTPLFTVDHPFLFAIRHEKTGAILFMGRIDEPQ
jgi:serpin B